MGECTCKCHQRSVYFLRSTLPEAGARSFGIPVLIWGNSVVSFPIRSAVDTTNFCMSNLSRHPETSSPVNYPLIGRNYWQLSRVEWLIILGNGNPAYTVKSNGTEFQ